MKKEYSYLLKITGFLLLFVISFPQDVRAAKAEWRYPKWHTNTTYVSYYHNHSGWSEITDWDEWASKYKLYVSIRGTDLKNGTHSSSYPKTCSIYMSHDKGSTSLTVSSTGPTDNKVRVKESIFNDDPNPFGTPTKMRTNIIFQQLNVSINSLESNE